MEDKLIDILQNFQNDKNYHELNAVDDILRLFNLVGQSEKLKCQCKKAQFTRTVDTDFNPLCGKCGKPL